MHENGSKKNEKKNLRLFESFTKMFYWDLQDLPPQSQLKAESLFPELSHVRRWLRRFNRAMQVFLMLYIFAIFSHRWWSWKIRQFIWQHGQLSGRSCFKLTRLLQHYTSVLFLKGRMSLSSLTSELRFAHLIWLDLTLNTDLWVFSGLNVICLFLS